MRPQLVTSRRLVIQGDDGFRCHTRKPSHPLVVEYGLRTQILPHTTTRLPVVNPPVAGRDYLSCRGQLALVVRYVVDPLAGSKVIDLPARWRKSMGSIQKYFFHPRHPSRFLPYPPLLIHDSAGT
jgi:hypothetical protein